MLTPIAKFPFTSGNASHAEFHSPISYRNLHRPQLQVVKMTFLTGARSSAPGLCSHCE